MRIFLGPAAADNPDQLNEAEIGIAKRNGMRAVTGRSIAYAATQVTFIFDLYCSSYWFPTAYICALEQESVDKEAWLP
jgi:hypothetical protein